MPPADFWGLDPSDAEGKLFYKSVGCQFCDGTGFHGRRGVFRLLILNNDIRALVREDMAIGDLQTAVEASADGSIKAYAIAYLWGGVTSAEEMRKTLDMFEFGKSLGGGS